MPYQASFEQPKADSEGLLFHLPDISIEAGRGNGLSDTQVLQVLIKTADKTWAPLASKPLAGDELAVGLNATSADRPRLRVLVRLGSIIRALVVLPAGFTPGDTAETFEHLAQQNHIVAL